ncbi:MAG: RNA methyltransferase [Flavobacterium sp. BFFFF1]|uniref:TrmH family RNA methyltransferase n=1 Tax=Flavobacterium sp. BFFFF1 TaxID=2015557 RepID=UPI000BD15476|nr:RNA methyltransferase [Flavobacterium sp. BFFFF1]OYU79818.1 MAG: RNA methyltransferase [Flavobacterium sp. BFFFF1]
MVSKNQIKLISSLQQKKYRALNGLFIAEGVKVISELLDSHFSLEHLYTTAPLFVEIPASKRSVISETEIGKISALNTANNALAVFRIPDAVPIKQQGLIVALDDIRDPGNLGTIIRLCDWFGIAQIVCSEETVDVYNPKVVQATMGSLARVNVSYLNLNNFLANSDIPVFGTFMDGENIYKSILPSEGIIVMGNEANGISIDVEKTVSKRLSIPRFGNNQKTESLNVATATAIILSEFCRNS